MFWLKLKAGALQLTLFIIVVIAILLMAFILLVHTHKQFQIQNDFIVKTIRNTDKGIDYALHNPTLLNDTTSINLENDDYSTLKIHRSFWGVFEKITTVSKIKNKRFQKIALIGSKQPKNNRTALYLQDNNKPLVVVGNTKIEGVTYLPKQGVKTGTISGQGYYGSQLIYGSTKASGKLPNVLTETRNQIKAIRNLVSTISNDQFIVIESSNEHSNSFLKPVHIIYSNNNIDLRTVKLTGHIIIQSKSKIIIDASSRLKDVVLIAPKVEIKDNVKGSFQVIASKKITVGNNVELAYPSALIINERKEASQDLSTNQIMEQNDIIINDNSKIKGLVVYLGEEKLNNFKVQIEIKEKATIIGELYCNQNTELKGSVYGTVYTNNFIANQAGSIYQNHIYSGTIIVNDLPKEYIGLAFNNSKKEILKWLY